MGDLEVLPVAVEPERDELFFVKVLSGASVAVAAAAAGLSRDQGYRRLHQEAFQRRLSEARRAATSSAVVALAEAMSVVATESIGVLRSVMNDESVTPSVRVSAASSALKAILRLSELEDARSIGGRLEQLEAELRASSLRPSGARLRGDV